MEDLSFLTQHTNNARVELLIELSENSRERYTKVKKEAALDMINILRDVNAANCSLVLDLRKLKTFSSGSKKLTLFMAENIAKENQMTLKVLTSINVNSDVKLLVEEIKAYNEKYDANSIVIVLKKHIEEETKMQKTIFFLGLAMVIIGAFAPSSVFKIKSSEFTTNFIQLFGAILVCSKWFMKIAKYKLVKKEVIK